MLISVVNVCNYVLYPSTTVVLVTFRPKFRKFQIDVLVVILSFRLISFILLQWLRLVQSGSFFIYTCILGPTCRTQWARQPSENLLGQNKDYLFSKLKELPSKLSVGEDWGVVMTSMADTRRVRCRNVEQYCTPRVIRTEVQNCKDCKDCTLNQFTYVNLP